MGITVVGWHSVNAVPNGYDTSWILTYGRNVSWAIGFPMNYRMYERETGTDNQGGA